jgi:hypothetical protein
MDELQFEGLKAAGRWKQVADRLIEGLFLVRLSLCVY